MNTEKEFADLIQMIKQIPVEDPPQNFADRITGRLQPKHLSFWKQVYRKACTPRTVSFTPVKLIPVAAAIAILFFVFLTKSNDIGPVHNAQLSTDLVPVTFSLDGNSAKEVSVIGSFNGWEAGRNEMSYDKGENRWTLTVMLPPGQYEYAFLINGEKVVPDPKALFNRSDGFGSSNSVIFTGNHSGLHL